MLTIKDEMYEVVKPRNLREYYNLEDYWVAPAGAGDLAYTWTDKPHRLIYDLIAHIIWLENQNG
jgi:hypothetical protein